MEIKIPKEKLETFDLVVRNIRSAVKNSVLYAPGHPVFDSAVKNLKNSLDRWFRTMEDNFNLGISPNNLLLGGSYVKEKDEFYSELAGYLYPRGLIALSFISGVQMHELIEFFKIIKEDIRIIREEGGVAKKISSLRYIKVKEIDYSIILAEGKRSAAEKEIWQTLLETAKESAETRLPESKFEFLLDFLKDPQKAASLLNKVYKQAQENMEGETLTGDVLQTVGRMYKYFKEGSQEEKEFKNGILYVVMHLDKELAVKLFENNTVDGENFDLAQEILKDFSDEFVSDFIVSLIGEEGSVNENLLKIFEKLTYDKNRAETIVPAVADTLLQKSAWDKEAISKLQLSIQELFKKYPNSNFMSQMYKITVHTFVDSEINDFIISGKLSSLAQGYIESVKEEQLRKSLLELLLNILWFEDEPVEFKKFTVKLMDILRDFLKSRDIMSVRKIFELFEEKLRPEQMQNSAIVSAVQEAKAEMTEKKVISEIIGLISLLNEVQLEDAIYVLLKAGHNYTAPLMETFVSEKDFRSREKIVYLLSKIEKDMQESVMLQLERFNFSAVKDFIRILNDVDKGNARLLAKKLIYHKGKEVRLEALKIFEIETEEEKKGIFEILDKETDGEIIKEIMAILLKTESKEVIDTLFGHIENNFRRRKYLLTLVELCGYLRVQGAQQHLRKILFHWSVFDMKKGVELRMASAVSLMQLGSDEAVDWIKKGARDKKRIVRRVCNIMMQLRQNKDTRNRAYDV